MASFSIHLAVAKRYLEKWQIEDEMAFYRGVVAPDLTDNKYKSHYSGTYTDDLRNNLANKVRLNEYLKCNEVNNEYEIGVFLHLVTDYMFYNGFFDKGTTDRFTFKDFFKNLYYSYDIVAEDLIENYEIDVIHEMPELEEVIVNKRKQELESIEGLENLLPMERLEQFIEEVSSVDLSKYLLDILEADSNVFPTL